MRLPVPECILLLVACTSASAVDIYADLDRTRAGAGQCNVTKRLPALVRRPALDRAASDMARGGKLPETLVRAGYRSTRSNALYLTGEGIGEEPAALLASKGFCAQMTDAGLLEVGAYRDSRSLWIVLAAPFAPAVNIPRAAAGQRVLDLINQARATSRFCGDKRFAPARPLRWNNQLAEASRLHSEDMARYDYFSHDGRDGSHPSERVERAGYNYRYTAENIAAGLYSPEEAVSGWINSPVHCVNLMNPVYVDMGAAYAIDNKSSMGVYWTQEFGTRR
jgi:uncharacterized protein YkwD